MNDFDEDFENFEDDNFDDFNQKGSLKETWNSSPLLKIFFIVAIVIAVVAGVVIFSGGDKDTESRTGVALNESETLGGEVSQNYAGVIEEVNEQRLERAVKSGTSAIPMIVNPEEQELLTVEEELPTFEDFDPLKTFRNAIAPQEPEVAEEEEPVLVEPELVFGGRQPTQTQAFAQQRQVAAPSPEAIQALAEAMSDAAGDILKGHTPKVGAITQVTPKNFFNMPTDGSGNIDTDGDGIPDTPLSTPILDGTTNMNEVADDVEQVILIPSGTINYAQILIEANSDVPGPVLAQLVSGPLSGARLIGSFSVQEKVLVLTFSSIIVNGINQPVSAVAIDPSTTLPGVASDVDNRYWKRVLLPAAAKFLEGIGSAISEDTETTVTIVGDNVVEETKALDLKQELGRGAEEGLSEVSDFLDDEAQGVKPLIRVVKGTPVGILFTEPVLEQ